MSELSAAEKNVFGELATKDENGNIVEKAIGFVKKEVNVLVTLTQAEFSVLVEKAKLWEEHVASLAHPATRVQLPDGTGVPVGPMAEPAVPVEPVAANPAPAAELPGES